MTIPSFVLQDQLTFQSILIDAASANTSLQSLASFSIFNYSGLQTIASRQTSSSKTGSFSVSFVTSDQEFIQDSAGNSVLQFSVEARVTGDSITPWIFYIHAVDSNDNLIGADHFDLGVGGPTGTLVVLGVINNQLQIAPAEVVYILYVLDRGLFFSNLQTAIRNALAVTSQTVTQHTFFSPQREENGLSISLVLGTFFASLAVGITCLACRKLGKSIQWGGTSSKRTSGLLLVGQTSKRRKNNHKIIFFSIKCFVKKCFCGLSDLWFLVLCGF